MQDKMSFLRWLFGFCDHYFGVPHPGSDGLELVQTCYQCSKTRKLRVNLVRSVRR